MVLNYLDKKIFFSAGSKLEGWNGLYIQKVQEAVVASNEINDEDLGKARLHLHLREWDCRCWRFVGRALSQSCYVISRKPKKGRSRKKILFIEKFEPWYTVWLLYNPFTELLYGQSYHLSFWNFGLLWLQN